MRIIALVRFALLTMGLAREIEISMITGNAIFLTLAKEKSHSSMLSPAVNQTWGQAGEEERSPTRLPQDFINVKMRENIVDRIVQYVKQFLSEEEGVTAIEYGLIAALIAVMIIGGVRLAGEGLLTVFNNIASNLRRGLKKDTSINARRVIFSDHPGRPQLIRCTPGCSA